LSEAQPSNLAVPGPVERAPTPEQTPSPEPREPREGWRAFGITPRSVLLGIASVTFIAIYSNTNDRVLKLSPLIGNHMPIGAFTIILLLATLYNPLAAKLSRRLVLGTRELAVVFGMMLMCSWLPGSSFYRYFHYSLVLPWTQESSHPDWQKQHTLSYLPDRLFPLAHDQGTSPEKYREGSEEQRIAQRRYERVYGSFVRGIPEGDKRLSFAEAPFREWLPVMKYWAPLVLFMALCLGGLSWLVHRQWSHHEQLSYPIASVSSALIERTGDHVTSDIFYSKLFWGGFAPVFGLHLINYLNQWFPSKVPKIPLTWSAYAELHDLFPVLGSSGYWQVASGKISFLIIGISYFIASEISLSMGLTTAALIFVGAQYFIFTGIAVAAEDQNCTMAGAYLAYFLILLFIGRHYYWGVIARALGLKQANPEQRQQVWAGRVFLLGLAGFVWSLVSLVGLDWFVSCLYAFSLIVYFLVFARVIAETGIPFNQAGFDTGMMIGNTLGFSAVGPAPLVMIIFLGGILNPDARECLTPYFANTLKIADNVGVRIPRLLLIGAGATLFVFALGFLAQTYSLYDKGAHNDGYALSVTPTTFDLITKDLGNLKDTGQLETATSTSGLAKLALIKNNVGHGKQLGWLGFGMGSVLLLSLLRFRFAWWPLHPVIFLMWGSWTSSLTWGSFLIGWLIKVLIVRFGGGRTYQSQKPLFIGMIMGEIVAVAMVLLVGFVYYSMTGLLPKNTDIFPG
jgi:hypothetical protein